MPIHIVWDNPQQTIIRVTFEGVWNAAHLNLMINTGFAMMVSVNHKVDTIFDFTRSTFSPQNLLPSLERMEATHSSNDRLVILVRANVYIKSLAKVGKLLAPKTFANLHFVNSVEAAYVVIAKQTQTVDEQFYLIS